MINPKVASDVGLLIMMLIFSLYCPDIAQNIMSKVLVTLIIAVGKLILMQARTVSHNVADCVILK